MCVTMRCSVSLFSVVSTNAIDYLGRFLQMTYCVSSGTLNPTNSTDKLFRSSLALSAVYCHRKDKVIILDGRHNYVL